MGAYNYIVFDAACPACQKQGRLRAQTHVASSFAGDERGRFCHLEYQLGEPMAWWPKADPDWAEWAGREKFLDADRTTVREDCYAECPSCKAELVVTLEFQEAVPVSVHNLRKWDGIPLLFTRV